MHRVVRFLPGIAALLGSGAASAHVGVHSAGDFAAGFTHPFLGLDHLLAMVAVGIWAVQLGGRYVLAVPLLFVTAVAAGAAVAVSGGTIPGVESGIALSVLALGLLVAFSMRAARYWAIPLVAAFALAHGYAHGAEMPAFALGWHFLAGVLAATATLHALGIGAGAALKERQPLVRVGGAAISVFGGCLLLFPA